ncbi:SDR family NAD(P)-dependent oxidoreductase [Actinophytocola oryzae]|uniref:SDR family NAD(P)-dependent oxidoreductase n=1 Tax=Actinophytocola oryzae TaxID=502181 RepID=UPI001AB011AC|nr:SDR family NAD(P)-dependent oxidoreductase [Actinophytocola oryzae]
MTGGNRGIGYAVCESLTREDFHVIAVVRDPTAPVPPRVERLRGDLSSRRTVAQLAEALAGTTIDVLIHNAGIWPTRLRRNEDGIEESFAVNHLAPFQLNLALEPRLRRVVQVSAGLYVKGDVDPGKTPWGKDFHRLRTYCHTKQANLLMVKEFAQRWQEVTIDAIHPGVIRTNLGDPGGALGLVLRALKKTWSPVAEAAPPIVDLATAEGTGRYFNVTAEEPLPENPELSSRLWEQARKLTGAD